MFLGWALGCRIDGRYDQINVTYKSTEKIVPIMRVYPPPLHHLTEIQFEEAKLHPVMLENIHLARYVVPTPVQVSRPSTPIPFISSDN